MEKEINIAELLKDAPKGTRLYSSIYGKAAFVRIRTDNQTIEVLIEDTLKHFDYYGKPIWYNNNGIMHDGEECMLFPSSDRRTWENFNAPWRHKQFEPFQRIIYPMYNGSDFPRKYKADIYSHWDDGLKRHVTVAECKLADSGILPYEGNEDKLGKEAEE